MLSMRLAARHSLIAATIGMPPATAASKAMDRPRLRARSNSSGPCSASNALLAVTTSFPDSRSATIIDRAGSSPPTRRAATEMDGSPAMSRMSLEMQSRERGRPRSRATSRQTARATTIGRPACRSMCSDDSTRRRTAPDPTVPSPTTPTRTASCMECARDEDSARLSQSVACAGKSAAPRANRRVRSPPGFVAVGPVVPVMPRGTVMRAASRGGWTPCGGAVCGIVTVGLQRIPSDR